ncbi:MAG: hypothetical protein HYY06_06735 [Deltaproteobacteria bacterium]|nr:hypothetical protein [Deltaproteobacteria bacterium]
MKAAIAELEDLFDRGQLGPAEASRRGAALCGDSRIVKDVVAFLQEVRRAHPRSPEVLEVLARAYAAGGRDADATRSASEAEALWRARAGRLHDRLAIARTLLTVGRPDDAEVEIQKALQIAPHDLDAMSLLGRAKHMRGELSEAIACWERVRAQSAHNEHAMWSLGVLHQLAQDPRRRTGESVVHDMPTDRRHLAMQEIERAFRLVSDGRAGDGLRMIDRLARREAHRDLDLFKLAVLARASIQDACGDLAGACRTLEALGEHPGFGADLDRLLYLVRLYEKSPNAAAWERALQVYEFLETRLVKNSLLGKLARLHERRANHDAAREYWRRHQAAFERRMGRPTLDEFLGAASLRSFGVAEIERLSFPEDERAEHRRTTADVREVAMLDLLAGNEVGARESFEQICRGEWATACDWTYLGDLRRRTGDLAGARAAWIEAVGREDDPSLQAEILGRALPALEDADVAALLVDPARRREVYEALRDSARRRPMDASAFRRLAALERPLGMRELASGHELRAAALEAAQSNPMAHVGHVQAAAAYYLFGRPKGLIHEVWASRRPVDPGDAGGGRLDAADMLGNLAPDLRALLGNLFDATRVYVQRKFPHRVADLASYRYLFKCTKEDELSSGNSAGLPVAIALVSVFLDLPVPQNVALSGAVVTDAGHILAVRRIGDAEHKVAGTFHKGLSRIVLPAENRSDVEGGDAIPRAIATGLVSYVRNLDEALEAVFGSRVWDI